MPSKETLDSAGKHTVETTNSQEPKPAQKHLIVELLYEPLKQILQDQNPELDQSRLNQISGTLITTFTRQLPNQHILEYNRYKAPLIVKQIPRRTKSKFIHVLPPDNIELLLQISNPLSAGFARIKAERFSLIQQAVQLWQAQQTPT